MITHIPHRQYNYDMSLIDNSIQFSIPDSTRTFFAGGKRGIKYHIWTPETIFKFSVKQDKQDKENRIILCSNGHCCQIQFKYEDSVKPLNANFLYIGSTNNNGNVCFSEELHHNVYTFDTIDELKNWAVHAHFHSAHKTYENFESLQLLTKQDKKYEIFRFLTGAR